MSDTNSDLEHDEEIIKENLFVSPETARLAAEDLESPGARKPASDEVEMERIARAEAAEKGRAGG